MNNRIYRIVMLSYSAKKGLSHYAPGTICLFLMILLSCGATSVTNAAWAQLSDKELEARLVQMSPIEKALMEGTPQEQQEAAKRVLAAPDRFRPITLSALSKALSNEGKDDDAAFWYCASDLRLKVDTTWCMEARFWQITSNLIEPTAIALQVYTKNHPGKGRELLLKVVNWDRHTPRRYRCQISAEDLAGLAEWLKAYPQLAELKHLSRDEQEKAAEKIRSEYLEKYQKLGTACPQYSQ